MVKRYLLKTWALEALDYFGGQATFAQIAKFIHDHHEQDLKDSGELYYIWQYELNWAGTKLRREGYLLPKPKGEYGPWVRTEKKIPRIMYY